MIKKKSLNSFPCSCICRPWVKALKPSDKVKQQPGLYFESKTVGFAFYHSVYPLLASFSALQLTVSPHYVLLIAQDILLQIVGLNREMGISKLRVTVTDKKKRVYVES